MTTNEIPKCAKCGKDLGRHEDHLAICMECTFKKYEERRDEFIESFKHD